MRAKEIRLLKKNSKRELENPAMGLKTKPIFLCVLVGIPQGNGDIKIIFTF